ncbi:MAG: ATP synthase F1 subunit delta [Deltaproteobacteria bacterium]|nr:ATP synthase F1 subunit delta [Deltaproteobacteria bacterium]
MIEKKIVIRYVRALLDVANRDGALDQVGKELMQVQTVLRENRELKEFLLHPRIPRSRKKKVTEEVFKPSVSPLVFHFLRHIVEKKREQIFMIIGDEFKEAADEFRGIVKAKVQIAVEISDGRLTRLKERLEQFLGKRAELQVEVIPEILGGVILQTGSEIVDGSIRGRLERIRNELLELRVV